MRYPIDHHWHSRLSETAKLRDLRVLIVDDQPEEISQLARALRDCGVAADVVTSGSEAIDLAEQSQPSLILADLDIPVMTGHELLERLNLNPRTKNIAVILFHTDWVIPSKDDPHPFHQWSKRTPSGRSADAHWCKPIELDLWMTWLANLLPRLAEARDQRANEQSLR